MKLRFYTADAGGWNRLREQLWRYWPALLRLAADRADPFLWSLLERAPTPAAGRKESREKIEALLKKLRALLIVVAWGWRFFAFLERRRDAAVFGI